MKKWLLIGILALGFLLRVIGISNHPSGFTPDEASFGYDAYSILKTGKDQWGNAFPLVLKSFGDYKAPLYTYILIPFVAVGGLNKEVVRLPNAIVGTLAILATYFLVLELFKNKNTALVASFLLAISSWHIMMSRGAFEANLTTFFLPLGLYFLLKGLKNNNFLYLGSLTLGLNLFTYHSAKIITPSVIIFFILLYRKELLKIKKVNILFSGIILAIFGTLTLYTFTIGAGTRAKDVSIFNGAVEEASVFYHQSINSGNNPLIAKLTYNKFTIDVNRFFRNYLSYFSPQFLFTSGPAEATYGMIPGRGVLYLFEVPFIILSLVFLIKSDEKRNYLLILFWILAAPIAAALATGPGYAGNRAEAMLPALTIIIALGFSQIPWSKNKFFTFLYFVISAVLFMSYLQDYFITSPVKTSQAMLYGNYEAAVWLNQNVNSNIKVVVDKALSEPHIYIAFAYKWDPKSYQEATSEWHLGNDINWVDQIPDYKLGNFEFKSIHLKDFSKTNNIYLVGKPDVFPDNSKVDKTFLYPNGNPAIEIVKQ